MTTIRKKTAGWLVMAAARMAVGRAATAAARTRQVLTIAAAAAVMGLATTACSSSGDGLAEEPTPTPAGNTDAGNSDAKKKYTMTVKASKGGHALTRALSYDDVTKGLSATWATGENVYMKKADAWAGGSLQPETDGAETTLKGSLTDITIVAGDNLTLQFPKNGDIIYSGQKGTLADIAANFDWATATVEVESVSATGDITPKSATTTFQNQQAIIKFTLMDNADGAAICPSELFIDNGTSTVELTDIPEATYTANGASNVLFVAFPAAGSAKTISLTATTEDGETYAFSKEGVKFKLGEFYSITVKMERQPRTYDLSQASGDITLKDGDTATGAMTGYQLLIEDGATVTLSDASVTAPAGSDYGAIRCQGDATIILADGTENKAQSNSRNSYHAVSVPDGKTLTITGTGKLEADGNYGSSRAGIGGKFSANGGNLIIEGGVIIATGGEGAAGIGAGPGASCGDITISGGSVTATGGDGAAGIGVGQGGSCGDIKISGGSVSATGGEGSAGIGSGRDVSCVDITISGGSVTATGGYGAAGIGGGQYAFCSNITISGGSVTATGGEGAAGIGDGMQSDCSGITVMPGADYIKATKGSQVANCIGRGQYSHGVSVTIAGKAVDEDFFLLNNIAPDYFSPFYLYEFTIYKTSMTWTLRNSWY